MMHLKYTVYLELKAISPANLHTITLLVDVSAGLCALAAQSKAILVKLSREQ
jgi:hypothetical protein